MVKIGFIGTGRMGTALLVGILKAKLARPSDIVIYDADQKKLAQTAKRYKVTASKSAARTAINSEVLILAVKPQTIGEVLDEIKNFSGLAISVAAGINLKYLAKKLKSARVIRTMPNNPALIGEGITGIAAAETTTVKDRNIAVHIFESVGDVVLLNEKHFDAVTGLSGSGPAFVYQFVEAMLEVGVSLGLERAVSRQLALKTVIGAINTLLATGLSPNELTAQVASPGGTTIEGLAVLEKGQFKKILSQAVSAAAKKSKILGTKFSS